MKRFVLFSMLILVIQGAFCQTLSEAAKNAGINFGTIVTKRQFTTAPAIYKQTVLNEFNMTFPENELKFNLVEPTQNKFAFGYPDSVVNWAIANGKKTRGHTLVWHSVSQNPKWLTDRVWSTSPNRWTREQLLSILKNHIKNVVGHFKGRITEWDVVNEGIAIEDGHPNGLRKSFWLNIIGDDYVDSAFVWAHQADPDAYLYFNEFGAEGNGSWDKAKSDSVYSLAKRLLSRKIPIHGIGFQGHFNDYINVASISANIKRIGDLGLRVAFTEVDMMNTSNKPTAWKNALTACLENKNCTSFVTWGVDDLHSWMGKECGCLIWDTLFQAKPSIYSTVLSTLNGANTTIATERKLFASTPLALQNDFSQYILLDQSFDNSNYPNWTTNNVLGTANWIQSNGTEARINSVVNASTESWLISSPVNMSGSANSLLSFDYKRQNGVDQYHFMDVLVSTNYAGTGNPNLASWISLSSSATWATGNSYVNSGKISLANYSSGTKLHVAFRMKATANTFSARYHFIDNVLITSTSSDFATDIDTIYNRLYKEALTNPSAKTISNNCKLLSPTGAFSDIDYVGGKNIVKNCTRLNELASGFSNPLSSFYKVDSVKQNFYSGLSYWVRLNQQTSNWWDRHINYTMNLWQSLVLMAPYLRVERPALLDSTIKYLCWGYQLDNYMESANGVNKINGAFPAVVVQKNIPYLLRMQKQIIEHIDFQNIGEGVEVDYMFGAHSGTGRQAYILNYGEQYILSVVFYMRATENTFAQVGTNQITQIENLFIKGIQWPIYTNANDPSMSGRFNQVTRGLGGMRNHIDDFLTLNTPQKSELQLVQKRLYSKANNTEKLSGNRMFWRFDYMIHRRSNYFSAHRLSSTRCVAGESGNGAGNFNFYNGSGVNYIYRTGKEFSDSLFSYGFNHRQYPGTTVEQDTATLPIITWGAGALNGNAFAGGASDGEVGAMGFKYAKRNVYAYKSTFFFDGEIVALGAGISRKSGTSNVYTTLNQCNLNGPVSYKVGNVISQISYTTKNVTNPSWIWHDSVLYEPISKGNYIIKSEKRANNQEVFTANIDHGLNPSNANYAYIIKPSFSLSEVSSYILDTNIQIAQNDTIIQSIVNYSTGSFQAVFYKPGSFKLQNGLEISTNQPCVLIYNKKGSIINLTVANPMCESSNPASVTVTLNARYSGNGVTWNGSKTSILLALPQGDYAGQSVTTSMCEHLATISTTTPTTLCQGGNVVLSASAGGSYIWKNGNTTLSTTSQTLTATASGSYTVEVTNANGCKATSVATTVTVNPLPLATITTTTPTTFCTGGSVVLSASTGSSYIWRNSATVLPTTTQTLTSNAAGTYTVEVTNSNGCKTTSAATTVTVNPLPTATISTSTPTTFCQGGGVVLSASIGSSYVWKNGNTTLNTISQTLTATAAGSYNVEVTNTNGCKATSTATTVTVNPLPTAAITTTTPTTFCAGGSVVLTASTGSGYIWRNGNTTLSTTTQTHTANAAGAYTVEVTNANGCKATSTATKVAVNPLPTATISTTTPTTFCQGGSVVLTASTGSSYVWRNGTTVLPTTTQTLTANSAGSYNVEVTNANGCKANSMATTVTVNPLPTATITTTTPTTFCTGGSVVLSASTGSGYIWKNGNTTLSTTTQTLTATTTGAYTVNVTNANGCKATSTATTVTVNPLPTATISTTTPTTFCQGGSVILTASTSSSYVWRNGNTTFSTTAQTHTANAAGAYTVEVTNVAGCKATSAPTTITENPLPTATISTTTPTTFCQGGSVVLTASVGSSYIWRNGNTALNTTTQTHTAKAAGAYTVEVTNANGCKATSTATTVTVNSLPTATISTTTPTTFCQGGSVNLISSTGSSYVWKNGTTTVGTTVSFTASSSGSYTVEVTNASGCKATSDVKIITENPLPVLIHNTRSNIKSWTQANTFLVCEDENVFTGPWPNVSEGWKWTGPNGFTSNARNPSILSITSVQSGVYTATYTDSKGCSNSLDLTLEVIKPESITYNYQINGGAWEKGTEANLCEGDNIQFAAWPVSGSSWTWTGPNSFTTNIRNPLLNNIAATHYGIYNTTHTDFNGCKASTSFNLKGCLITELTDEKSNEIKVFPNPCSGSVYVTLEKNTPHQILLLDLLSNEVYKTTISQSTILETNLSKGIYLMKITGELERQYKLVIE